MSLIQVNNLTYAYDGSHDNVFENVSFRMDSSWRLGLIGRNGRGKTTLLRLLLGELDGGGSISSPIPFAYFPYEVTNPTEDTRVILEALCPDCLEWEYLRELSLLDVDEAVLDRPFETLSGGERTKVLLAALFLGGDRFLLIDEPTNHLDQGAREAVSAYLSRKSSFILVSHDRALLDSCVDHILSINLTDIDVQQGNYSTWQENFTRREQYERGEQEKLRGEVKRLDAAVRSSVAWSDQVEKSKYATRNSGLRPDRGFIGHKSAKMMKRAKSMEARQEKALDEAKGLLKNLEHKQTLKLTPLRHHARLLVELRDVQISYGGAPIGPPVRLNVEQGERIALGGKNGSGKSSLLKLILGEEINHTGQITLASGLVISYVSQQSEHLRGSLRDYIAPFGVDETQFMTILRKLGFSRDQLEKNMEDYSQGQRKKVLIARSLCESAHLYLWDEPLNFIDIPSRLQIEELILEYEPTLLFVEHDETFRQTVATRTVSLDL